MLETDDDDFMPSSSTSLSAIFNATISTDNTNLSYKAPKQLKDSLEGDTVRNPEIQAPARQSAVILAKIINLWKVDNGENKLLGKHIVAVIGNENQRMYEMIVYKEKTNILFRQQLDKALILYKYPKNFIGIYNTHKQFWNLNFESVEDLENFLKKVLLGNCQIKEQNSENNSIDQDDAKVLSQPVKNEDTNQSVDKPHANDTNSKNKILSRITKVGQQIFPKASIERNTSTELSDSESDSNYSNSEPPKPAIAPRKFRQQHDKALVAPIKTEKSISHPSYFSNDNQFVSNNNQMILNPQSMMYAQPYGVNNLVVAQNAELKASLAEINLKLATVLNAQAQNITVDKNGNNEECVVLKSKIKSLNLKIENLQMDLEIFNRRFGDLKTKYDQKCSEQGKNESWKKNLTEEINRLQKELDGAEKLRTVNIELSISIEEKNKLIEIQQQKLKYLEDSYLNNQEVTKNLEEQISDMNLQIEQLTLQAKDYEEKLKYKEDSSSETRKNDLVFDKDVLNKKIKESMNEAFRGIMSQFDESEEYSFNDVQHVVLENLKKATYSLINTIQ